MYLTFYRKIIEPGRAKSKGLIGIWKANNKKLFFKMFFLSRDLFIPVMT